MRVISVLFMMLWFEVVVTIMLVKPGISLHHILIRYPMKTLYSGGSVKQGGGNKHEQNVICIVLLFIKKYRQFVHTYYQPL